VSNGCRIWSRENPASAFDRLGEADDGAKVENVDVSEQPASSERRSSFNELGELARSFIAGAFEALREEHVIPTPVFHPYIAVGRDYFGDTIRAVPAYRDLEGKLDETYPERFGEPLKRRHAEFASSYIFSFLEACIARCGRARTFAADSAAVQDSIDELLAVLGTTTNEIVCCRHVSHVTTTSGDAQIADVVVVPEADEWVRLLRRICAEIPGAATSWNRDDPRPYDPPHALLITREMSEDPEPYEVANRLSRRLERFLFLIRLLTGGTVQSAYEISGATTLVAPMKPQMSTFRKGAPLVRRTVRLTGDEGPAFAALSDLIDAAEVKREGMVATSFDVALIKFNRSYSGDSPYEHLVDLATALEAALIGAEKETEGLTLRLRSRVAALLATDDDPARALFRDVGLLYGLRSRLVHGGQIKEKDLRKDLLRISTVPAENFDHRFSVALGHAVDRMRDLVRRAILVRLCLAAGPNPVWPFDGETPVDAILSDDAQRASWRARWHERLDELAVGYAGAPSRSAVDYLSQEDH
jgi:hypothetical protein